MKFGQLNNKGSDMNSESNSRSEEEIEKMCIEDPSNLIKWHITDARLWTKSFNFNKME